MVVLLIKIESKIFLFLGIEVVRYNELNFRPEVCGTIDLIRETLELEMQI